MNKPATNPDVLSKQYDDLYNKIEAIVKAPDYVFKNKMAKALNNILQSLKTL